MILIMNSLLLPHTFNALSRAGPPSQDGRHVDAPLQPGSALEAASSVYISMARTKVAATATARQRRQ